MSIDHAPQRFGGPLAVSPAEAARIAGVGRTSLYRALAPGGGLKSFKFGRRRLIRIEALQAWLKRLEETDDAA